MAENIQRSRGRPSTYRFDRGGMPTEFGPFIGIVKNNIDPTRSGRLQVYIEQFSGDDPEDSALWRTVSYIPPFYGATPLNAESGSTGAGSYRGNQNSYGMWFTPPDLGVKVICFFVSGDPNQGYYIGCVPEPGVTHMIPAIGAGRRWTVNNDLQQQQIDFAEAAQMPVVEINVENPAVVENAKFWNQPKPIHGFVYTTLFNQGLLSDYIRGPISSSSQRESPSAVFGISTPGRPIYAGGIRDSEVEKGVRDGTLDLQDVAVSGRRGGHTIVMDDGDLAGRDNLIRIRTAKGHQITMSDEADCLYIIAANGQTWIELGSEGTVDVYSTNSVNVRSQGEINLHADKNINICAGENLNIRAGNIQVESQGTTTVSSIKDTTLFSKSRVGVLSDGSIALNSDRGGWLTKGAMAFKGARIDLNGGPAPETVKEPAPIKAYKLDDTKLVQPQGWQVTPASIDTIVTRAPTHEPYPYHNRGVPVEIKLSDPVPTPPPAATTQALAQVNAQPVTVPVDTASVVTAATADVKIGSLDKTQVTGLLAQAQQAQSQATGAIAKAAGGAIPSPVGAVPGLPTNVTGLAKDATNAVVSATNGLGKYGLKPEQLEAQGLLKPGAVDQFIKTKGPATVTPADEAQAARINAEGGSITADQVAQNRQLNQVLSSPMVWSGKEGVGSLDSFLGNPKVQDLAQQSMMSASLSGLQKAGLITGNEPPQQLSAMLQSATKFGVKSVSDWTKGVAPADVTSAITGTARNAQFSTAFVDTKLPALPKFAKTAAPSVTNTVDRAALDQTVADSIGDAKVDPPAYQPQEREAPEPSPTADLENQFDILLEEAVVFIDGVKTQFDLLFDKAIELDRNAPLSTSDIDAFQSNLDQVRAVYNNNRTKYIGALNDFETQHPELASYTNPQVQSIGRLIKILVTLSTTLKEQVAKWRSDQA
jgi:hypothetical protein